MVFKKNALTIGGMLAACAALHLYSSSSRRVEFGYSSRFFPALSRFLRFMFGWLPFSFGDILYGAGFIFLLLSIFRFCRFLFRRKMPGAALTFRKGAFRLLVVCCSIYLVFNIFWGINYNREGIASRLNLDIRHYSVEDLKMMNGLLVAKINSAKAALLAAGQPYPTNAELFAMSEKAYDTLAKKYSFLAYRPASLKSSLWSNLGNYTGFLGYYDPFTGEAQVNTTVPKFTQPFTACHETAHQLGYAKEMEANFVGYLAAAASPDTLFHYSVYTDLFLYANRTLFIADSAAANEYRRELSPAVLADFAVRRKFNLAHTSFLEVPIQWLYSEFLKSNQQPLGMLSYDEVTAFIIAYYKKFGTI